MYQDSDYCDKWDNLPLINPLGSMVQDLYSQMSDVTFVNAKMTYSPGYDWEMEVETNFSTVIDGEYSSSVITAFWDCSGCSCDDPPNKILFEELTFTDGFRYSQEKKCFVREKLILVSQISPVESRERLKQLKKWYSKVWVKK